MITLYTIIRKGLKVGLLKVRHRPSSVSWFFSDFVPICADYQWVIHIISDFVLSKTTLLKTTLYKTTLFHAFDRVAMRPKCSWLFMLFLLFQLIHQIHRKMLMVVNHMPFLSWISKCSMFVKLYVTVMHQCGYGNLIPIMLRIVYLAEPSYRTIFV